jgi:hypothetical protein
MHLETQGLRHRVHEKLMRAFLDPAVFDGRVRVHEDPAPGPVGAKRACWRTGALES